MIKLFSNQVISLFFLGAILCIPLPFFGNDILFQMTQFLFRRCVFWIQNKWFPNALPNIDFSSDTIGLNLLLVVLFLLSIFVVVVCRILKRNISKFPDYSRLIICYYLAFVFLKYGVDKVFKTQFYLPEPNILYTPFGYLTKDILFWSSMGSSYFYSVSLGILELIVAILLLFHQTRILGLFLSLAVLLNIVLINFGFDISVKTFSLFLFSAAFYALLPFLKTIFLFFIYQEQVKLVSVKPFGSRATFFLIWVKSIVVLSMLYSVLFPYLQSQNWNDDQQKRPFLHGAYEVVEVISKGDTLEKTAFPFQKIMIHRNNYLILQNNDFQTTDYYFKTKATKNEIIIMDYQKKESSFFYEIFEKDSTFILKFQNMKIKTKMLNWKQLPVLNTKNHYTIDEIK